MKFQTKTFTRRAVALGACVALAASLSLTGCGGSSDVHNPDDDNVINIAACSTPHSEILENVVAPILEEEGYTLNVITEDDYSIPNKQVAEGDADCNYFQHQPYLDSENEQFDYDIVAVASIHYEPFGVYAGTKSDLKNIAKGDKIAIPNDTTNEARALLLLEQEGLIKVDEDAGITATPNDVVENPYEIDFVETDAELIPHVLSDVAFGIINANYAIDAGLNPSKDALAVEDASGTAAQTYANILAVRSGDEDSDWAQALAKALTSDEVRDYIEENYSGAVLPVF